MPSIIIPANNEAETIAACLEAIAVQTFPGPAEVIVSANGCLDDTVKIAESRRPLLSQSGYQLIILDRSEPSKIGALNAADAAASHSIRIYIDADVICSPELLKELVEVLTTSDARYASGQLTLAPANSWITRQFGRTWLHLPFVRSNVPGAGLFSVNGAGRARWAEFPDIIADDLYVRLHFSPAERIGVEARYFWPLAEGLRNLVRVRRRQDAGVIELSQKYPELLKNESKTPLRFQDHLRLFLARPVSYAVYVSVRLAVRLNTKTEPTAWARGR